VRVLVWQWGRRGAGPRFAVSLADAINDLERSQALLSLSDAAEILAGPAIRCDLPVRTYSNAFGLACRLALAPLMTGRLRKKINDLQPDVAVCAMPGPLDLLMLAALHRNGTPAVVIVHDADAHPGDDVPLLMPLQRRLTRRADAVVALSGHVARRLREQGLVRDGRLFVVPHPPFFYGPPPPPPLAHDGKLRLLCFGRLLPYKGLDLLAAAVASLPSQEWELRVVGSGPESPALAALRATPGVTVENRWVPEDEVGALIAWADALVLPYKEASQSGIAPAALAAGRFVVSTRVGGLVEQLADDPQALLCEPDVASLVAALRTLLATASNDQPPPPRDPRRAWQDAASLLLDNIAHAFPAIAATADLR
jgi:glycosyltransferase involved in cell wall biosynthesis